MAKTEKKQNFLQGAAVLAAGVALVKLIGAIFKIPLGNLLTGEGFGYFNIAYSVYNVLLVISTAGLPVAVSKLVAEAGAQNRRADISRVIRAALTTFLLVGAVGSIGMFVFAQQIANLMKSSGAVHTIRMLSPAVFGVALMSVYRGYYQGMSNMYPTAISQVLEALAKLLVGFVAAWILTRRGDPQSIAAAGAVAGVTSGTILGAVFLLMKRAFDRGEPISGEPTMSQREAVRRLLAIAVPITIGSGALALTNFIDTTLVMRRLQDAAGFTEDEATWLFGAYGLSQTMFNFPSAFIVPFASSVVPAVAAALAVGDGKTASRTIETSLRITSLLALPAAAGLSILAGPILNLLFAARPDEVAAATVPLNILAIAVFFNSVVLLTNAILQSLGKVRVPVYTMLVGAVIKIGTNWVLVGQRAINIKGAPIGTCLCYFVIMSLNLIIILRSVKPRPNLLRTFARPLLATLIMAACTWAAYGIFCRFISWRIAVLAAIVVAVAVYFVVVILLRAVTRDDVLMLPKGEKIAKLLRLS